VIEAAAGSVVLDATVPAPLRERLAVVSGPIREPAFRLRWRDDMLGLEALAEPGLGTLEVELLRGRTGWRGSSRARHERLVRACGLTRTGHESDRVLDGTGGLGTDAWLLANAGARVRVVEQHPVLRALLEDGLRRAGAERPEVAARVRVESGDSRALLATPEQVRGIDVLYLDPMYPERRKAALGDRRLRLVAALLAADGIAGDDAAGLVEAGLAAGIGRVVLKRPVRVRVPVSRPPGHSLEGRSTRFDVWVSPGSLPEAGPEAGAPR
jgi:16S rRNA (guanine1516-N2)-methyltransferase